jgi:hypothetical protein
MKLIECPTKKAYLYRWYMHLEHEFGDKEFAREDAINCLCKAEHTCKLVADSTINSLIAGGCIE